METEHDTELLSCKCGCKEPQVIGYFPVGFLVDCHMCGYFTATYPSKSRAIASWNTIAK